MAKTTRASLQFSVAAEEGADKLKNVRIYAFSRHGEFISSALIDSGKASLDVGAENPMHLRLYIAPAIDRMDKESVTIKTLERMNAYEPSWLYEPTRQTYELQPIPSYVTKIWPTCKCRVRGKVVKNVVVNGISYPMPVCQARVHICEIDKISFILPRIPDSILDRLRDKLKDIVDGPWPPIPIPQPDPPPFFRFDPSVVDPSPINIAMMNRKKIDVSNGVMFDPQPDPPAGIIGPERMASRFLSPGDVRGFNPQPDPPRDFRAVNQFVSPGDIRGFNPQPEPPSPLTSVDRVTLNPQPLPPKALEVPADLRTALFSSSQMLRESLIKNVDFLRPILCYFPWTWPYFYRCDEVATVSTDHSGRFDISISYPCFGDKPDLYFWVEYMIGGVWTTVYAPPRACNTRWNFTCGSEVTIHITDPRVPWCGDDPILPGKQLAILSIGHGVSMAEIRRSVAGVEEGLTTSDQPFGGSCEPIVWFGDGLRTSGITHFRWSYRRLGSSGAWTAMDATVVRHYGETQADTSLVFKPYLLGPQTVGTAQNLFEIKPNDPPLAPGATHSQWAPEVDSRSNSASGYFLTHLLNGGEAALAQGKYEIKLELFHADGSPVNLTAEGVLLKQPTTAAPFGIGTVPTRQVPTDSLFPHSLVPMEDRAIRDGGGNVVAYRAVLHVDNQPCDAFIYDAAVGANTAGACGFIKYPPGGDVNIRFRARHPNHFATFSFWITKGSIGTVESTSGETGPSYAGSYARNAFSIFQKDIDALALVNAGVPCPGGKAAFSENLYIYAKATDGYSRLSYLDDSHIGKAFALEPV